MPDLITLAQLHAVFPKMDAAYAAPINETLVKYAINTDRRIAAFLAQSGHESARFMRFEENLNYSAQGLNSVFHKYFPTMATATQYARQPQKIANIVYANRMGNGAPASNDGWNFRGRGAIQITGRDNYTRFAHDMKLTLDDTVKFVAQPRGAVMSAGWFWNGGQLNLLADAKDMVTITKRINGGKNGLDERIALYNALIKVL